MARTHGGEEASRRIESEDDCDRWARKACQPSKLARYRAIDYLMKPSDDERFAKALARAKAAL